MFDDCWNVESSTLRRRLLQVLHSEHCKTSQTGLVPGALLQLVVVPDGGDHHQVAEYSQEAECHLQEHCGGGIIGGRVAEAGVYIHCVCGYQHNIHQSKDKYLVLLFLLDAGFLHPPY